ncbi:DUF4166 domain-containing protein [Roseibium sp. FZY0029]|uniref:DUF4166 domain-containing protein n=1 Tax=Roseibium sp. FZY0029 TaxID=3116647 RepID=UPI002E99CD20|nr:DUF4166 domain-containing protein [Roseibium sp. FZY0029]
MTEPSSRKRIVILGGYGVFGGKLAEALLRHEHLEVIVAGRSLQKAEAFCRQSGGTAAVLNRTAPDFAAALQALHPFITIDAAGPFQAYRQAPYAVAEAALDAGSHYLDLSDDAGFTGGIIILDEKARAAGLTVLSGVSSVPALSSVAVEALRKDFSQVDLIESAILPGNRAPRGLSVIEAILAQAGQPVAVYRDGRWTQVIGWSGLSRRRIGPEGSSGLARRWSSYIGAPDLALFPDAYHARTVLFRAGLELPLLHLGLWGLSWLVRLRLVRSLEAAAPLLRTAAGWFERFGSDRGGMEVRVAGLGRNGMPLAASWTLIAEAGDGPHIPAVPGAIMCRHLYEGDVLPGARPCLGEFSLSDVKDATAHLTVHTYRAIQSAPVLFQQVLGATFKALPEPVRSLHTVFDQRQWAGEAKVTRGTSRLGQLLCRIVGFPPAADATPVTVTIERQGRKELWLRNFGGKTFRSVLSLSGAPGSGVVQEWFGPTTFNIHLNLKDGALAYPVGSGKLFGLPLPCWLLPVSEAVEAAPDGTFRFDVEISLPGLGRIVRYQGWLKPSSTQSASENQGKEQ